MREPTWAISQPYVSRNAVRATDDGACWLRERPSTGRKDVPTTFMDDTILLLGIAAVAVFALQQPINTAVNTASNDLPWLAGGAAVISILPLFL
jgi:hypothetical protein